MKLATSIIPKRTSLADDVYDFSIEEASVEHHPDGRKFFKVVNRVTAPPTAEGLLHTEQYYIGVPGDLEGEDPETQKASPGASFFTRLLDALGFDTSQDIEDIDATVPTLAGMQYTAKLLTQESKKKPGQFNTNIKRYWKLGDVPAGSLTATAAPAPRAAAPAARPTNGQAGKPVMKPAAPAAKPVARPAAKPAMPAGFEIEE